MILILTDLIKHKIQVYCGSINDYVHKRNCYSGFQDKCSLGDFPGKLKFKVYTSKDETTNNQPKENCYNKR